MKAEVPDEAEALADPVDTLPLSGVLVLDFSQFLAGPVAALRLADLGARVVKVERPGTGEIGRTLAFAGRYADGDTLSFHAMNRNKEGITADLKDPDDLARVLEMVAGADVVIQNFRPGVMERIGLDFAAVRRVNPSIVYASASGYGDSGPFRHRPGQDLLAQSVAGLPWRNGPGGRPVPVGLALADHLMSCHLALGVVALLVRRARTGRGGLVETSLLEGMLDLQRDELTAILDGGAGAARPCDPASALHRTRDGFLAVVDEPPGALSAALDVAGAAEVAAAISVRDTDDLVRLLDETGVPCAPLLGLEDLVASPGFAAAAMTQQVVRPAGPGRRAVRLTTTRSPIRVDGSPLIHPRAAPRLGQDNGLVDGAPYGVRVRE